MGRCILGIVTQKIHNFFSDLGLIFNGHNGNVVWIDTSCKLCWMETK